MKFFASITTLASIAAAASVDVTKRSSPLDVKIAQSGNSGVHAAITNTGSEPLRLLKTGTILDDTAVEKISVFSGKDRLAFDGVRLTISHSDLPDSAFKTIKAGETIEVDFDAAELHDLSVGGAFDMLTSGSFSYAGTDSNKLIGSVPFKSNTLSQKVNGLKAASAHKTFQAKLKRTNVQSDCSGSEREATVNAINACASQASAARQAATSDSSRMEEYFKSSSSDAVSVVEEVFRRVEDECGSIDSGVSDYYCTDQLGACQPGVIAYTLPSQSFMVNCPTFFQMPTSSNQCDGQAQDNTILHEMTHLSEIAGTDDFGGYGYDFVQSLSPEQNLAHADTYTLFAQSIAAGC